MQQLDERVDGSQGYRLNVLGEETVADALYVDLILPLANNAVSIPDLIVPTGLSAPTILCDNINPLTGTTVGIAHNTVVVDDSNSVTMLDNFIVDVPIHGATHTSDFSQPLATQGQFMCVHHSTAADPQGFCFGPDPDETTGDFNVLVNDDSTNAVLLFSNVASVITPMFSADKTTGEVTFPGGIQSDTLDQATVAGVTINQEMTVDHANTRVDINNTLRCDLIDSITGINGVVIDNTLAVNNSTNVVDIAVGSTLRSNNITSLSGAGISSADSISIANTKTLSTNTINSTSALGIEIIDTLAVGTSTQPANVSDSVIQIKSKDGTSYGNPVGSALLYVDLADTALKSKNAAGQVVNLSSLPSYGSFYRAGNGTDSVITTAGVYTKCLTNFGTTVANGMSIATQTITYTAAHSVFLRFNVCATFLTSNNNLLVGFGVAKNPTYNGSDELVGSVINGSFSECSVATAGQESACSSTFIVAAAQNDTFAIVVVNNTSADDINLRMGSISVQSFSAGTD